MVLGSNNIGGLLLFPTQMTQDNGDVEDEDEEEEEEEEDEEDASPHAETDNNK